MFLSNETCHENGVYDFKICWIKKKKNSTLIIIELDKIVTVN